MKNLIRLFALIISITSSISLSAQNWTGNVNNDWNNSANWSAWPLAGQDLTIDPAFLTGAAVYPTISSNSSFSPGLVLIQNGGLLTIGANLTTQDDVEVLGVGSSIIVNNGSFSVNPGGGGRLVVDLGATLVQNSGNITVDERFIAGEDAIITINNGVASSGQRLLMDLGGKFIQNNGVVNVAQTFAMADGNINGSSQYILNGGTLNITGEMAFENEAGNFAPTFLITGGNLNVNGDIFWFGAAPGSGTPRFISTGGAISANGLIENLALSTVNMFMEIGGNSMFSYSGSLISSLHPTDSIIQRGTSSFTYSGTNTVTNAGTYLAFEDVTTTFNGTTTFGGLGNYNLATILINNNKSLTLNQHISLKNDFIKNGVFNPLTFRTSFIGSAEQLVSGTSPISFYDLRVNTNLSDVSLLQKAIVTNQLELLNGKVNTTLVNILEVLDNATAIGANELSFVNGPLRKIGNDAFIFPVGKNVSIGQFEISAPQTLTSQFVAEYFDQAFVNTTSVLTPLSAVSTVGYWNLTKNNATDQVQFALHWDDATQNGITDCAALSVAHWNTTEWNNIISLASGACSGNGSGSVQTAAASILEGNFTLGFFGNVSTQNFAVCFGDSVEVNGLYYQNNATLINVYTDINNEDSTVISTIDILPLITSNQTINLCVGEIYTIGNSIYSVNGLYVDTLIALNGCDSIVTTNLSVALPFNLGVTTNITPSYELVADQIGVGYQWIDCITGNQLLNETNQNFIPTANGEYACVLNDGLCSDTSECIAINDLGLDDNNISDFLLYPNPSQHSFSISANNTTAIVDLTVLDLNGKKCFTSSNYSMGSALSHSLQPGVYFVKITQDSIVETLQLIVE